MIDPAVAQKFQGRLGGFLDGDATLLWAGRSSRRLWVSSSDLYLGSPITMVLLAWSGILGADLLNGKLDHLNSSLLVWGATAFIVVRKLVLEPWARSRLYYGVTESRALVLRCFRKETIREVPISTPARISWGVWGGATVQFDPELNRDWRQVLWRLLQAPALEDGVWFVAVQDSADLLNLVRPSPN